MSSSSCLASLPCLDAGGTAAPTRPAHAAQGPLHRLRPAARGLRRDSVCAGDGLQRGLQHQQPRVPVGAGARVHGGAHTARLAPPPGKCPVRERLLLATRSPAPLWPASSVSPSPSLLPSTSLSLPPSFHAHSLCFALFPRRTSAWRAKCAGRLPQTASTPWSPGRPPPLSRLRGGGCLLPPTWPGRPAACGAGAAPPRPRATRRPIVWSCWSSGSARRCSEGTLGLACEDSLLVSRSSRPEPQVFPLVAPSRRGGA